MRIQNEQSGSSSLFAQPMAVEAIPEDREHEAGISEQELAGVTNSVAEGGSASEAGAEAAGVQAGTASARKAARTMLEARIEGVLAELAAESETPSATVRQGHLALLKRWYYRPEAKRTGEIFFPDAEEHWPVKAILRGVGRMAAKSLTATPVS
jgi:hypothetical protein